MLVALVAPAAIASSVLDDNTDSDDDSVRVRWAENPSTPRRDLGMLSEASSTNDGHEDTDADADAEDN